MPFTFQNIKKLILLSNNVVMIINNYNINKGAIIIIKKLILSISLSKHSTLGPGHLKVM